MAKKKKLSQKHPNLKWLLPILVTFVLLFVFKAYIEITRNSAVNNYESSSITPTMSTTNWKVYQDQMNGYSIKYPENWNNQEVVNEGGTSMRFYENGVTPRQAYMMAEGNEQLILSTITNQTLQEVEDNIKIKQTTIAGKPAIRLSTGAYIQLSVSPNVILSVYSPKYPQPAMDNILNSLEVGK